MMYFRTFLDYLFSRRKHKKEEETYLESDFLSEQIEQQTPRRGTRYHIENGIRKEEVEIR